MKPYYSDDHVTLYHGDCLEVLATLPDASVDSVVTDPPYGLEFMGKAWDSFKTGRAAKYAAGGSLDIEGMAAQSGKGGAGPSYVNRPAKRCAICGKQAWSGSPCRCAEPEWVMDNSPLHAFQEWCEAWTAECLRVLKPGGHMLAFGGTRTWHRLAAAVEDAGFEIRDSIAWLYGSGFPKSLDVSKAIDKRRHDTDDKLRVTRWLADVAERNGVTRADVDAHMGTSDMGGWWLSRLRHRCAIPTLDQVPRLLDVLGVAPDDVPDEIRALLIDLNGMKGQPGPAWGQREVIGSASVPIGHAFAGSTYGGDSSGRVVDLTAPATPDAERWQGWGTALKPAFEPIVVGRKPLCGTVAQTVLQHGTGALNIAACRVEAADKAKFPAGVVSETEGVYGAGVGRYANRPRTEDSSPTGRWPANVLLDDTQAAELDRQSGVSSSNVRPPTGRDTRGIPNTSSQMVMRVNDTTERGHADTGGASRFFPTFRYEAKAPTSERPRVDGMAHPTVKPLGLMRWLVRLVTPPGGTVLEPFAGSGTTAEACVLEGFQCIAIEREPDYLPLIVSRLSKPMQLGLDFAVTEQRDKHPRPKEDNRGLVQGR